MAEVQKVPCRLGRRLAVVHEDAEADPVARHAHPHDRHIASGQHLDQSQVLGMGRGQDDAVRLQGRQDGDDLAIQVGRFRIDQFEQHPIAVRLAREHGPVQHLIDPVVAAAALPVVDRVLAIVQRHQQIGPAAAHPPGGHAGDIAQLFDSLHHAISQIPGDVRLAVYHARDRLDRDTGGRCDVTDGDLRHRASFNEPAVRCRDRIDHRVLHRSHPLRLSEKAR